MQEFYLNIIFYSLIDTGTMIGKLQNILNKTAEEGTKSEVQEFVSNNIIILN